MGVFKEFGEFRGFGIIVKIRSIQKKIEKSKRLFMLVHRQNNLNFAYMSNHCNLENQY